MSFQNVARSFPLLACQDFLVKNFLDTMYLAGACATAAVTP